MTATRIPHFAGIHMSGKIFQKHGTTRNQKFPAAAGIFNVNGFFAAVYINLCDKALRP